MSHRGRVDVHAVGARDQLDDVQAAVLGRPVQSRLQQATSGHVRSGQRDPITLGI